MSDALLDPVALARNLTSMQRIDPCAVKIFDKATHSALYKFQPSTKTWEKTDVDGTLFIYQRADKPFYSLMIVNRQSLSDFIEPIVATTSINQDKQFVFMRKADGDISCLWFYKDEECKRIYMRVAQIIADLKKGLTPAPVDVPSEKSASPVRQVSPPIHESQSNQLLEMLKAAQPNSNNVKQAPQPSTVAPTTSSEVKPSSPVEALPTALQKLMFQEQPKLATKPIGNVISAEELEKDLVKDLLVSAKPKLPQDLFNVSSGVSLAAFSTRSVQGSASEGEGDAIEVESLMSRTNPDFTSFVVGSESNTPPLDKSQFLSAISFLLQNDDEFVAQIHQAYVDALNRRLRMGGN